MYYLSSGGCIGCFVRFMVCVCLLYLFITCFANTDCCTAWFAFWVLLNWVIDGWVYCLMVFVLDLLVRFCWWDWFAVILVGWWYWLIMWWLLGCCVLVGCLLLCLVFSLLNSVVWMVIILCFYCCLISFW